ncbi:MAG: hypothetical protein KJ950_16070 [Proteobacteria bacterium]|nr:hypothetical protein [Pseudomonadota bacterium]MBU1688864.1 hypothetical protein [Pseudomonadota bacterium]
MSVIKHSGGSIWYEKYLPFVAKSPEMQYLWLVGRLSKLREADRREKSGTLSRDEITPYVRIFLESARDAGGEQNPGESSLGRENLAELLKKMDPDLIELMLECTDIYDVPIFFALINRPTKSQAVVALRKVPPPFEKDALLVLDRVFHSIRGKSERLLEEAADEIAHDPLGSPENFIQNYRRFQEIMMDEQMLGILYPKAR